MLIRFPWAVAALCAALSATFTTSAMAAIECTCRYKGQDFTEGTTLCVSLPTGDVLMQCGKVLNNTAWKTLQNGCELSQNQTPWKPKTKG